VATSSTGSTNTAADLTHAVAENKRRALVMLAGVALVVLVLGCVLGLVLGALVVGALAGLVVGCGLALVTYLRSERMALARSRAVVAGVDEFPRYHNLVEGLCVAAGLPKPELYVVEDPARNAFVTGRDPKHAAIAVTTGMLDELNRVELEGVLACELSRIKSRDTLPETVAVLLSTGPMGLLAKLGAPRPAQVFAADAAGVQLTRYPPGLCSALQKVREGGAVVRSASRATAALWLEWPLPDDGGGSTGARAPLAERIRILEDM
jgi:heat shock protein HtpX